MNSCFVLVLILLVLLCSISKPSFSAAITQLDLTTDQNALLAFKNTITWDPINDDAMFLANNWSSSHTTSVCSWIGVSCSIKHQRVISLNISGFGLSGTLPPHLGNLTFLRYLDMSSNDFTGPIPYELSRLRRLREIDMGVNSFTGEIPSWFGALPRLEQLRLYNNTFWGEIPGSLFNNSSKLQGIYTSFNSLNGSIPEEISNCSSLKILSLNYNQLRGPIPHGLFNLPSLEILSTAYNELSGSLPSDMCNNLPNLTFVNLSGNQIEGQIPHNIWKCRELEMLSLSYNRFNGEIPSEIGRLSMLRKLYLGFNDFKPGAIIPAEFGNLSRLEILSIRLGPIPKQFGNCTSLEVLDLRENHLTGELPQELCHLPYLEGLGVFNNSLSGSIPSSIFNMSTLKRLDLAANQFSGKLVLPWNLNHLRFLSLVQNELSGEIPSSITNASMLTNLELSANSFSGSIPNFGNLRSLQTLSLWSNNLTSQYSPNQELEFLTELTNCQSLESLEISGNPLTGILPPSVGNLSASLRWLGASNCNITGVIPSTIGNLSNLALIVLEGNQLAGSIPPTIGNLKQLERLYLRRNRLQGCIPPDLCRLSNIYDLQLNDNNLTGPIPDCLGNVRSLRDINLGSNKLNSTIPSNFWNLKDLLSINLSSNYLTGQLSSQITSLKVMNLLDLSHNQLSGGIPGSIDGCQMLGFLSLSNNKLEGSIPSSLGNIRGLSSLDLSNNNLSGTIPGSLAALNFLRYINVSFNKLEGEIPTGGSFSNFTAQSFLNNSALCGATKFQVSDCVRKNITTSRLKKIDQLMKYVLPPFTSLVILATIIVLLLMRRRNLKRVPVSIDNSLSFVAWRRISYIQLVRGTNAFSETNLLGRGSFSSVFKTTLSDGLDVGVKVFNLNLEKAVRSFDTECEVLGNIRHRNLVRVVGCCSNPEFKALILEYMSNGSLEKWLHSENYCLDLMQSLQIAIDIASALEYLHHGHTFPIVHCDIKPSNVLLDEDMVAHLADFGISKLFDDGETMVQTKTLATIGYAAPEYGSEGKVSTNGDVYSYGILLLEIFTRKKPTENMFDEEMSLREWVNEAIQENAVLEVATPGLLAREDQYFSAKEECVSSVFSLSMKCLAVSPDERINMVETVAALQRIKTKVMAVITRSIIAQQ